MAAIQYSNYDYNHNSQPEVVPPGMQDPYKFQAGPDVRSEYQAKQNSAPAWRRWTFILIGILVFLVVLAAILGGVLPHVLHQEQSNGAQSTSGSPTAVTITVSADPASQGTKTALPSSTPTFSTSQGPGSVAIQCPSADNLPYTVPGTSTIFLRQCNTNYGVSGGAIDAGNFPAYSMEDCMNQCASWNNDQKNRGTKCLGVNWMYAGPQGTDSNYCWIKSRLGNISLEDSKESAVLIQLD